MKYKLKSVALLALTVALLLGTLFNHSADATVPGINTVVSVNNSGNGQGGNGNSPHDTSGQNQAISADGKFVAFTSNASNLVANDTNGFTDVFLRNLITGSTSRVNISTSGVQSDGKLTVSTGSKLAISGTGRYVAFTSYATNLIDGQVITSSQAQLYLRDTVANTTKLVTQTGGGVVGTGYVDSVYGVSDDGRFILWSGSGTTNLSPIPKSIYMADLKNQSFTAIDPYSEYISGASMSCDGSLAVFTSINKLTLDDTDNVNDVYLVDLRNGQTITGITTSSASTAESLLPSISCNGNYVTFDSKDTAIITSGVVPTDTHIHQYLYDRINGSITLVDTSSTGVVANYDVLTRNCAVDNQGDVVFYTGATNLVDGHTMTGGQVYLKHKDTSETELISRTPGGSAWAGATGVGGGLSMSTDGKKVTYVVASTTNLLSSHTNGFMDVVMSDTGL